MPQAPDFVKLGSAVLDPIINAYKAGGIALALILVGTVLLLAAVAKGPGVTSYISAGSGALVILAVLARVYFVEFKEAKQIARTISDNQALLNSIQDSAIQLTEICAGLQTLAFKHSDKVGPLLKNAREAMRSVGNVPFIGKTDIGKKVAALAEHENFKEADDLAAGIVETTENAKKVIAELRRALTTLDAKPLIQYSKQLSQIRLRLTELLKRAA